jgi:four helix bundle protein
MVLGAPRWCARATTLHVQVMPSARRRTHRDLIAWQASMQLLVESYRVAAKLPEIERYGLASQLRRTSVSIAANIAEGFGRSTRGDYRHHLSIASGSLCELQTHLEAITLLKYLPKSGIEAAEDASRRTGFLLYRLQKSLSPPERP